MIFPRLIHRLALSAGPVLLLGVALPHRAAAVNVAIDTTRTVRTVDERVFGVNAVIWDGACNTPQTIALLQTAGTRALRFPGGSASDEYHWKTDTSLTNTWTWATSFDAFANVVTNLNPRPQVFITANYGTGTPQEAADWVTYANITKALGVKYWEIGNECYGSWETDSQSVPHDPYTYAIRTRDYVAAMKAADPTVKIGVVVITGEDSYANNTSHPATNLRTGRVHNGWTPVLLATLRSLGVTPDFAIYHRYEQTPGLENDASLLQMAATWPNDAADLRQQLSDYLGTAGAGVELVVTENNSVYADPGKQSTSLVNGLYLADSLGNLLQTEFNSLLWWDLRNGQDNTQNNSASLYGWRQYGDYGVLSTPSTFGSTSYYDPYPTYYVMKLLSHFARGGDTVVSATSDNALLSVYAARRLDGSLSLLVLNKSPTDTLTANFSLNGFTPQATATTYVYGIPQDDAVRTGMGSPDVATSSINNASTAFAVAFTPYSATVLSLTPTPLTITTQPASKTVTAGDSAMFAVLIGSGSSATYQWQRQAAGSGIWSNLTDTSTYSGSTTATLTVNATTTAMSGDSFQCVITVGSSSVTSSSATLTVNAASTGGSTSSGGGGGAMETWFVLALAFLVIVRARLATLGC